MRTLGTSHHFEIFQCCKANLAAYLCKTMSGKLEISESRGNASGNSSPGGQSLKDGDVKVGYSSIDTLESNERPRARDKSAFEITGDVLHYKPIASYEGIHRWDPDFEWDEDEEKKIVRKASDFQPSSNISIVLTLNNRSISAWPVSHALRSLRYSLTGGISFKH